jgi:FixJ family two-component response regulator
MSDTEFTVFIVDDDPGVLRALLRLVRATAYQTWTFSPPRQFLAGRDPTEPGRVTAL